MNIHYYTVCRDEEELLPFVLEYYQDFVNQFTFFVNVASRDKSAEIIDAHPLCRRIVYDTEGKLRDDVHSQIKSSCWKESAGRADWVIITDLDEFLYHQDLTGYLESCSENGITIPETRGFDMFSDDMPVIGKLITKQITRGVYNRKFSKSIIFDPGKIEEINYSPGGHFCRPEGYVRYAGEIELKLLHYKYIGGLERLGRRWNITGDHLSEINKQQGWGVERMDSEEIIRRYNHVKDNARPVIEED